MGHAVGKPLLKQIAEKVLGSEQAEALWKRIEIIGDIAVIRKPYGKDIPVEVFRLLGEEILKSMPYVKSVWLAASPVQGAERVREYIHLAGEKKSETTYKEHGCVFKLDIVRVYVSPVLGYDHMRIARQVKEGETVLNMFAGYGPYSVILSKHARPRYVVSVDINEYAVKYARINIELNKIAHSNEVIQGDALIVAPSMGERFDRILMPYPDLFEEALKAASRAVKEGGYLHPHLFVDAESKKDSFVNACNTTLERLKSLGLEGEVVGGHVIRSVGPRRYHVTVDIRITKKLGM
uniref:Class I SAM-dependent methyltransferase family protein n=1 Tax=Ignisphaera aggregans TaxID=334771 RepID=A0A7C2Z8W1_9CREN